VDGRAEPSPGTRPDDEARRLIRTRLPGLLASGVGEPTPVLVRSDVPAPSFVGRTALDQWTYVCAWLSDAGVPGLVYTLEIVGDAQAVAHSEPLSRWAADFVGVIVGSGGGGGEEISQDGPMDDPGNRLRETLQRYVEHEMQRWQELRRRVVILGARGQLSEEAVLHVEAMTQAWEAIRVAIVGVQPGDEPRAAGPVVAGSGPEPGEIVGAEPANSAITGGQMLEPSRPARGVRGVA
jgi:hypothetical protein